MADLAAKGSVLGGAGDDSLIISGTALDLRSTTLSSIEILQTGTSAATTFTVDQADLASKGSVLGGAGNDTLTIAGTSFDLTSTTLSSVEILKAGVAGATTFKLDLADLAFSGSVFGSSGVDTLTISGTSFDLTGTTLSSIEILKGDAAAATLFKVDLADLASKGSVLGGSATDTLIVGGTAFDLSSTMLSSVEVLQAATADDTTFTVDQADLASKGSVIGGSGVDTLAMKGTALDLTSTSLDSVEILKAAGAGAAVFTIDSSDLAADGSVIGGTLSDTLSFMDNDADLTGTTLSSIEIIRAGSGTGTTFTVDQADLAAGGSVIGSSGNDSLVIAGTSLDLSSTGLSSIEGLKAGTTDDTVFKVDQADLLTGMTIFGSSGTDTLTGTGATIDLRSVTLSSIEILQATATSSTTFIVDQADLASGGSVIGNDGSDILKFFSAQIDLTSTTLSSIEIVMASGNSATTFIVDDGAAGVSLTGVATAANIFRFTGSYGLTNVSDDNSILADTATITNFNETSTEIIDVSALTNGATTFQSQATTQTAVNAADPTVFKDALDAAAAAIDGSTNSVVTSFIYGGATYVLIDNSSGPGVTTDDVVIKLSGSHTLTASEFLL
jgi:uncharacterized protein YciI